MRGRSVSWLAAIVLAAALAQGSAQAGNLFSRIFLPNPPGSSFYPDYSQTFSLPARPVAVPAYPYGYFGARSKPFVDNHYGYYNDFRQTVYPRGL